MDGYPAGMHTFCTAGAFCSLFFRESEEDHAHYRAF